MYVCIFIYMRKSFESPLKSVKEDEDTSEKQRTREGQGERRRRGQSFLTSEIDAM
jgi:hypothetical protein